MSGKYCGRQGRWGQAKSMKLAENETAASETETAYSPLVSVFLSSFRPWKALQLLHGRPNGPHGIPQRRGGKGVPTRSDGVHENWERKTEGGQTFF